MAVRKAVADCTITISKDPESGDRQVDIAPWRMMVPANQLEITWQVINATKDKLKVRIKWIRNETDPTDLSPPFHPRDSEVPVDSNSPSSIKVGMQGGVKQHIHKYNVHLRGHVIIDPELEIAPGLPLPEVSSSKKPNNEK
jgi:hypothetical protein